MKLNKFTWKSKYLLLSLLILGFLVRLYRFDGPVADWHSWRQADTSSVSRDFVDLGFDLLHPTYDDLSNVPSGVYENPKGYRFVEFPIYNVLQAVPSKFIGALTLEEWGRLVSILASLFSAVFIFKIVRKRFGDVSGIMAAFFFLFIPYNIYYSRSILPDPLTVTTILGSIYLFQKYIEKVNSKSKDIWFLIMSFILITLSFLLKPYALFFVLPLAYLAFEKYGKEMFKIKKFWVFALLSVLPFVGWRLWMTQYPQGIPQSNWLFNGNNIRFRPSFFYWIFYERLTKLILGFFGVPIFLGLFLKKIDKKNILFLASFAASCFIYVSVIATGNVQHDYYQILIIPAVAIFLGVASDAFIKSNRINKYVSRFALLLLITLSFAISGNYIKDFFNINDRAIVNAGIAVDKLTPKSAKIIANYNGDTSFLYQTKRKGWASFEQPVPVLIQMGADFLVLANPTPQDLEIGKIYKIVESTKEYVIFDLNKKP